MMPAWFALAGWVLAALFFVAWLREVCR